MEKQTKNVITREFIETELRFYNKEVSVGNVHYDLTSQGDEFYIIYYKGFTEIKLIYSLKMYVLKDK